MEQNAIKLEVTMLPFKIKLIDAIYQQAHAYKIRYQI